MYNNTTGNSNTAVGLNAMYYNSSGIYNTAVGSSAMQSNTTGSSNTAVGMYAMLNNTTGSNNTVVGQAAMTANTIGTQNTAVGQAALTTNTTGNYNTAIGQNAMYANTTGQNNTAVGQGAMNNNTSGNNNTALGSQALYSGAGSSGSQNTSIGMNSLYPCTGNNNAALGYNSGGAMTSGSNNACLGYGSGTDAVATLTTQSNYVVLGNNSTANFNCKVALTVTSDARDKTNIAPVPVGLNYINTLKPVTYNYDDRGWYENGTSDGSKTCAISRIGFLAQDVLATEESLQFNYVVNKDDPENLKITYTNLLPILVKAVQELSAQVTALQTEVALLKSGPPPSQ
jgi:hypothetical protein